ncbi:MAG: HlyD family efflux transporter periplasmic adaptor subunit [Bacillota bacterium]
MRRYNNRNVEPDKPKKNKLAGLLIKAILLIITLSILFNLFLQATDKSVLTEYGTVVNQFQSQGLFIRQERVTFAPLAGKLDLKVKSGKRVQASTHIATIKSSRGNRKLYSYNSGLVSYQIDGLESTLAPTNLGQLTYQKFKKIGYKKHQLQDGTKLNSGRPVFKIIDNFILYLAVPIDQQQAKQFKPGMKVKFELTDINQHKYQAVVNKIINNQQKDLLILEVKRFIPLFMELRKVDVSVIRSSYQGIVVPTSVIRTKDGKDGVMVVTGDGRKFKEVNVVGQNQHQAVIKGIEVGIKVLKKTK